MYLVAWRHSLASIHGVHYSLMIASLEQFKSSWHAYINVLSPADSPGLSGFMLSRKPSSRNPFSKASTSLRNDGSVDTFVYETAPSPTAVSGFHACSEKPLLLGVATSPNRLVNLIGQNVMNVNNIC